MNIKFIPQDAKLVPKIPIVTEYIDIDPYDGAYEVIPSESAQTLLTDGKRMTDNVTVDAVPSDYVGSAIDRNDSSDLTVDGPTVTVPAGYYDEAASKAIPEARSAAPAIISVSPKTVSVDANGLVTAMVANVSSGYFYPFSSPGYVGVSTRALYDIRGGQKTLQLDTRAGATITPTESEQTAVAAKRYTTGEVKVAAIPSDYIGSEVPQKSSSDLTVSGDTVTVPAGYYAEAASKSVQAGSATTPDSLLDVSNGITITVSNDGQIYAGVRDAHEITPSVEPGYVSEGTSGRVLVDGVKLLQLSTKAGETITPTKSEQTAVLAQRYTTGDVKIGAIPEQYYDMSGPLAWLGAGAELVTTLTLADVRLADTNFATWTPSTTATDILATRTAGTFVATDVADYDYIMVFNTVIPIVYLDGAVDKARPLFLAAVHVQECIRRPSSYANIQAESNNNTVHAIAFTAGNFLRYYGSTQGSATYTWNTSYGFYGTYTAATFSSATAASPTVTVKTPKVTARCSTTYMSTSNAALIDQDKTVIKQSCKVYRVKKSGLIQGAYDEIIRIVNEVDQ